MARGGVYGEIRTELQGNLEDSEKNSDSRRHSTILNYLNRANILPNRAGPHVFLIFARYIGEYKKIVTKL